MFAKAMSFAGRKVTEADTTKMDGNSKAGDPAAKRRQFGRDITNSTVDVPTHDKNAVFKPSQEIRAVDLLGLHFKSSHDNLLRENSYRCRHVLKTTSNHIAILVQVVFFFLIRCIGISP